MPSLLSYEEFIAERRAEQGQLEGERKAMMQVREQLVAACQRQTQERLSQLDAVEELLRMRDRSIDGEMVEVTAAATAGTAASASPSSKPHLQVTIGELKGLTQELSRLRRTEAYLEILLSIQQSMYSETGTTFHS